MMSAPIPSHELNRVMELQDYYILDTPPEVAFDHITSLTARHLDVPISLVTFVDADRQWFKSCFGTNIHQMDRKLSFCAHALLSDDVLLVPDASADPRFCDNPLVVGASHIRSYAGAPLITPKGQKLGTLCVMDTQPRRFSVQQKAMLIDLSVIVMDELELRLAARKHRDSERKRRADLSKSQIEILQRLARAAEYRDDDTGQHTQRVARTTAQLARELGYSSEEVAMIKQAAPLHDVGKISVSDLILLKPSSLSDEEFTTMRAHASVGAKLLSEGRSSVVRMAERIAGGHHERWDGNGYPHGLSGDAIPLEARILAVADVFDALTHERPYKKAWSVAEAVAEIARQSGTQFDPRVVEAFMTLKHDELI